MLYIHTYLHSFENPFHVTYSHMYTFIGKAIFILLIHIFRKAFLCYLSNIYTYLQGILATYLPHFEWHIFSICIYMHLRSHFVPSIHTYSYSFERQFMLPIPFWTVISCHILRSISVPFSTYMRILQSIWLPIQHMYALFERYLPLATYSIYTCTWGQTLSNHLSAKKFSWCSLNQVLV